MIWFDALVFYEKINHENIGRKLKCDKKAIKFYKSPFNEGKN